MPFDKYTVDNQHSDDETKSDGDTLTAALLAATEEDADVNPGDSAIVEIPNGINGVEGRKQFSAEEKLTLEILLDATNASKNSTMGIWAKRLGYIFGAIGFSTEFVTNLVLGSEGAERTTSNKGGIITLSLLSGVVTALLEWIGANGLPNSIHEFLKAEKYLQQALAKQGVFAKDLKSGYSRKIITAFAILAIIWIGGSTGFAEGAITASVLPKEGPGMLEENYGVSVSSEDLEVVSMVLGAGRGIVPGLMGTGYFLAESIFRKLSPLTAHISLDETSLEKIKNIEEFIEPLIKKLQSMSDEQFNQSYSSDDFSVVHSSDPEIKQQTGGYTKKFVSYTVATACAASAWWLFCNAGKKASEKQSGYLAATAWNSGASYGTGAAAAYMLLVADFLYDFLETLFAKDVAAAEKFRALIPSILALVAAYFSSMFIPGMIDGYMSEEDGHSDLERQLILYGAMSGTTVVLGNAIKGVAGNMIESYRSHRQSKVHADDKAYVGNSRKEVLDSLKKLPELLYASTNPSLIASVHQAMCGEGTDTYGTFASFIPSDITSPLPPQRKKPWFGGDSSESDSDDTDEML